MNFFLPKQSVFFDDLNSLNGNLQQIVSLFAEFAENFKDFENYARKAKDIEHQGDAKTHDIIDKLNKTFITPIDREDIYLLSHQLDDIIDLVENVIHNIKIYGITTKFQGMDEFAQLMLKASREMEKMLGCLQKLKHNDELSQVKINIHELEDRADEVFEQSIGNLFATQPDPILVIKLKDILEGLEHIMDKYQTVCDIIEGIVVKAG